MGILSVGLAGSEEGVVLISNSSSFLLPSSSFNFSV
jgi:hypothetical protein